MPGDVKSKILRDAERHVLQGRVSQAIAEYQKIIKTDPNDVLTINTVGDLCLRQGKIAEANSYFCQVAEAYARNNFLLKAIAVYKKILKTDPKDLATNQTLAALFTKQGLNADARNQYMSIAELCAEMGNLKDSVEAYERVVELDPNNANVQLKLAEIHLSNGGREKAQSYYAGAARAHAKAGSLAEAIACYQQAVQLNPCDMAVMKGFLDTSIQLGDARPVLDQLEKSLLKSPDNLELLEMLGRAHLATGDLSSAQRTFREVLAQDATKYSLFLDVHKAFLDRGELDAAATALDGIVPILVSSRASDKAVEAYEGILKRDPNHAPAWSRLAQVYSATNKQEKYVEALEKLVSYHLDRKCAGDALEPLEQILQVKPDSRKHLNLHRQAFEEAFPGLPYTSPVQSIETSEERETRRLSRPAAATGAGVTAGQGEQATLVDVELLLNYGMIEKALDLLRTMEAADPSNKEVRQRLIAIYTEQQNPRLAAEQCLLLAAEYRKLGDEEAAQKWLVDAEKLDKEFVISRRDVLVPPLSHAAGESGPLRPGAGAVSLEVDLSEDLSEIFFKESPGAETAVENDEPEEAVEEFSVAAPPKPPLGSLGDQLQEVDFYIRLGFYAEARSKLDEISKDYADSPELPPRYKQISDGMAQLPPAQPATGPSYAQAVPAGAEEVYPDLKFDFSPDSVPTGPQVIGAGDGSSPAAGTSKSAPSEAARRADAGEVRGNALFADLLDEVNAIPDQESVQDDFETHFSLGIAYREMGLIDEAIKEYQGAIRTLDPSRSAREVIQCCGMLSTCYLEKGMPRSAIRWCESGLKVSEISPHETMALQYDMGVAFSLTGDTDRALGCFDTIYEADPGYRDVAQKIDELRGGLGQHAL